MNDSLKYRLVIFDLDGTLLNTLDDLYNSVAFALSENGLAPRTKAEVRQFLGNGMKNLIHRSVPDGTDPETELAAYRAFRAHYKVHCTDLTAPYPGIPEALSRIKEAGIHVAVLSNKADPEAVRLCNLYVPGLFDSAAGEREGIPRKPSPEGVLTLMKGAGASPGETLYVGDSEVDIETAKNAGVSCLSVNWGFRDTEQLFASGASKVVSTAEEMADAILLP